MKNSKRKYIWSRILSIIAILALFSSGAALANAPAQSDPPPPPRPEGQIPQAEFNAPNFPSAPPGYCSSSGGSTSFEYISSVYLEPSQGGTYKLTVNVFIANPTGCQPGEECPDYDPSPEYVNVWIDWNGDQTWDDSEKVMDAALTGYLAINYRGTMTAVTQFTPPPSDQIVDGATWMRANLGWNFDPNDPCTSSWSWGNVVDKELHPKGPQINSINAKGVGTDGDNPTTGFPVRMEAELTVPAEYEITECSWTGDLTPGLGDVANKCRYEYTPATGAGPSVNTYGPKNIVLTVSFRQTTSGATGQTSKPHSYKVFFEKKGDDDGDSEPNWFDYWGDDGAVPAMNAADVRYSTSCPAGYICYGAWSPSTDNITLKSGAAETHYASGINPTAVANQCPGGNFGGAKGIDSAAEVMTHERRHETIYHNWDEGGAWNPNPGDPWADSDDTNHPTKHDRPGDDLPDNYEATAGTSSAMVDSCDLATIKGASYAQYGDNEYDAIATSDGATGVAAKDWANPGKQSDPAFLTQANLDANASGPFTISGPAHAAPTEGAPYHPAAALANLTGAYSSNVQDTDSDGMYNMLTLSVGVQVTTPSNYNIVGWLESGSAQPIAYAATGGFLTAGGHTVELIFDGRQVRDSGYDGPYNISRVELREGDEDMLEDAADNVHSSASYNASQFDPFGVVFSGTYSDSGMDTDADTLFNILRYNVGLTVDAPGSYTIIGELDNGQNIAVASTTANLSAGSQSVNLDFDGAQIYQSRVDGPYNLARLRVSDGMSNTVYFANLADTSNAYAYTQFQHGGVTFDGTSFSDQGLDVDSDAIYDYLRVEFDIISNRAGSYQLSTSLRDQDSNPIYMLNEVTDLIIGTNNIVLDFPGGPISAHGADGPYMITSLSLVDNMGAIVDSYPIAHTTQAYSASAFADALIALSGSINDVPEDSNSNGFYDSLHIDIGLLPGSGGVVVGEARLTDAQGNTIDWFNTNTTVTASLPATLRLSFDGALINASHANGPYYLQDLLVYNTSDPNQSASTSGDYTTQAYDYGDFEGGFDIFLPAVIKN